MAWFSSKYYVCGCRELEAYFRENNVTLNGHDSDFGYFLNNDGKWIFRRVQELDSDKWSSVNVSTYLKAIDLDEIEPKECTKGKDIKGRLKEVLNVQIGGSHYQGSAIQPIEYIMANKLNFPEGCVVKYISRHRKKNGKEDLLKVIQNVQMILADEYGIIVEFKVKEND